MNTSTNHVKGTIHVKGTWAIEETHDSAQRTGGSEGASSPTARRSQTHHTLLQRGIDDLSGAMQQQQIVFFGAPGPFSPLTASATCHDYNTILQACVMGLAHTALPVGWHLRLSWYKTMRHTLVVLMQRVESC